MLNQKLTLYIKHPQAVVGVSSFGSQQVYVIGAVSGQNLNQASMLTVPITSTTPATLASALSQAGGINTASADTRLIYVIRPSSLTHPSVYWLNMQSPTSMMYAENFPLTNNDVVFVSTAGIARTNDVLAQILPFIQTLWFTKSLVAPNT
jgi:polysaccharide export outer membrane protein